MSTRRDFVVLSWEAEKPTPHLRTVGMQWAPGGTDGIALCGHRGRLYDDLRVITPELQAQICGRCSAVAVLLGTVSLSGDPEDNVMKSVPRTYRAGTWRWWSTKGKYKRRAQDMR